MKKYEEFGKNINDEKNTEESLEDIIMRVIEQNKSLFGDDFDDDDEDYDEDYDDDDPDDDDCFDDEDDDSDDEYSDDDDEDDDLEDYLAVADEYIDGLIEKNAELEKENLELKRALLYIVCRKFIPAVESLTSGGQSLLKLVAKFAA